MIKFSVKWIIIIAVFIIAIAGSWYSGYRFQMFDTVKQESSEVLLERVKKVTQLVTVQAEMSEIYTYQDFKYFDISMFRKKALLRVKAKVLIGYDIENFSMSMDDGSRTITLSDIGDPDILAIDHDLDYYDIDQATFNTFTNEDYNNMNSRAKKTIEEKARQSNLYEEASKSKEELYDMLRFVVENAGWKLVIEKNIVPPQFQKRG